MALLGKTEEAATLDDSEGAGPPLFFCLRHHEYGLPHASRFSKRGHHGRWYQGVAEVAPTFRRLRAALVTNGQKVEVRGAQLCK